MIEFLSNSEAWIGVGFVVVLIAFAYLRVPGMVAKQLDERSLIIARELDAAKQLREEAAALLAQYRQKAGEAENEAASILTDAKADAERFAVEARTQLKLQIERRTQQAQQKIAQAEAQAMAEIRALAADAAAAAAENLIAARIDEKKAAALVSQSISELPAKLN